MSNRVEDLKVQGSSNSTTVLSVTETVEVTPKVTFRLHFTAPLKIDTLKFDGCFVLHGHLTYVTVIRDNSHAKIRKFKRIAGVRHQRLMVPVYTPIIYI